MRNVFLDPIPPDRRETAKAAMSAAFGRAQPTALEQITRGASGALIYRTEVANRPYLLRLETKRDAFNDTGRGYICMQTAAKAGIAPRLYYADPAQGVAIMDFLPSHSLFQYPTGRDGLAHDLGALVARLQETEPFPAIQDYPVILDGLLDQIVKSGRFAPGLLDPHRDAFKQLVKAYEWDKATTVSSHNDLNPGNIIFDGRRLWFVDWEVAFRNDPLIDLANLSNYLAPTPELQDALLSSWQGRAPDRMLRARLVLARQFARLGYACIMITHASAGLGGSKPDNDLSAPGLDEFHSMLARGRVKLSAAESLYVYGKVFLNEFRMRSASADYLDALSTVSGG